MPRYEYKQANDPRMVHTYEYIERELWRDDALYRYPPQARYDGVAGADNPFGACSFWMIDYLARLGRVDKATRRFERLLGFANDVGLYGEQFDHQTKKPLGNFPQAITHVGLIDAAVALQQAAAGKRGREIAR
jgi:GH15 family glucan-1,4-alpha-glucosidase